MKNDKKDKYAVAVPKCYICNKTWIAIFITDTNKLQCPNCNNMIYNDFSKIEDISILFDLYENTYDLKIKDIILTLTQFENENIKKVTNLYFDMICDEYINCDNNKYNDEMYILFKNIQKYLKNDKNRLF